MVQCASVYTCEVDDPSAALAEIQGRINKKITLRANTVGVVMCHAEFVGSGVLEHILKNLPFDVAGVTTSSMAANGVADEIMLSIFIMTADDAFFRAGMTGSVRTGIGTQLEEAYRKAAAGISEQPKLALIFPPFVGKAAGDEYIAEYERLTPGTPVFGTVCIDDTTDFSETGVILNETVSEDGMAFILCYGTIQPRFAIATLAGDDRMPHRAEITKSEGPRVDTINNISARQYLTETGVIDVDSALPFFLVPFLIDQKKRDDYDGVPVVRGLYYVSDDGPAVFRGYMDERSILSMLTWNPADVAGTTREKLAEVAALDTVNGILACPCTLRRMMLAQTDNMAELTTAKEEFGEIPFMMGYSGGEICPTSIKNGVPANRFHNFSLVILIL